jgi:hypothetical protein
MPLVTQDVSVALPGGLFGAENRTPAPLAPLAPMSEQHGLRDHFGSAGELRSRPSGGRGRPDSGVRSLGMPLGGLDRVRKRPGRPAPDAGRPRHRAGPVPSCRDPARGTQCRDSAIKRQSSDPPEPGLAPRPSSPSARLPSAVGSVGFPVGFPKTCSLTVRPPTSRSLPAARAASAGRSTAGS